MKSSITRFNMCFFLCAIICVFVGPLRAQEQPGPAMTGAAPSHKPAASAGHGDTGLTHPAMLKAKAPDIYEATFTTTKGDFVVQVTRSWAPNEADRFYNLVKHGYFSGVEFFRLVPGFVVQFGLTGSPNSRSTQVFINLGDNAALDHSGQGFAPFGKITSGMDVVQNLYGGYADQPTNHQDEITNQGNAYLQKNFPKLDSIKSAKITSPAPAPAAAATHKSAAPQPKPQQ